MKRRLHALALCCCLTVFVSFSAWAQEVQVATLRFVNEPVIFNQDVWDQDVSAQNISTFTKDKKVLLADEFSIQQESKITGFHFVGQFGSTALENLPPVLGVHLFVFDYDNNSGVEGIPFSDSDGPKAHFYLEEGNPGLTISRESEKTLFHVDLGLAGEELILDGVTTYWLAFAPELDTNGLPEDQVWYWYAGNGGNFDPRRWETGATSWEVENVPSALAFSIEGEKVVLGSSDFNEPAVSETVFPNPSNGVFTIASIHEIVTFEIFTTTGKSLIKGNSDTIDLSNYPNGIYIVTINYVDEHKSRIKLIKV